MAKEKQPSPKQDLESTEVDNDQQRRAAMLAQKEVQRPPQAASSFKIEQLLQTLAHNPEDIGYTETIRPALEEETETSTFIALPLLPFGKQNGILDLEELGILGEGGMGQVK